MYQLPRFWEKEEMYKYERWDDGSLERTSNFFANSVFFVYFRRRTRL